MNHNDILILGGTGLLGSNFTKGIKLSSKDINLLDYEETKKCFNKFKPKLVIHSACKKLSSKLLYSNPADYFNDNVIMSLNIFKASAETKIEQLIVISSINALLAGKGELTADTHNHRIKNILTEVYEKQYSLNSKVFCLTNIFGPFSDELNGFIPFIIKKCYLAKLNNENINLKGDKNYKRDFMYVKDAVNLIEQYYNNKIILSSSKPTAFYSGITHRLQDVVNMVTEIMDFKGEVIWSGKYDTIKNKDFIDKFNQEITDFKFTPVYDGIVETINWYKEIYKWQKM